MLKAKIEGYRVITTTNQESKKRIYDISIKKYNAKEIKSKKKDKSNVELLEIRLRGTSRETWRHTIKIWSLYCPPHASLKNDRAHPALVRSNDRDYQALVRSNLIRD